MSNEAKMTRRLPTQPPTNEDDNQESDDDAEVKPNVKQSKAFKPRGPIGLLVAAMMLNNIQIAAGFEIHADKEHDFHTLDVPWQTLRPMFNEIAMRARQHVAMGGSCSSGCHA